MIQTVHELEFSRVRYGQNIGRYTDWACWIQIVFVRFPMCQSEFPCVI